VRVIHPLAGKTIHVKAKIIGVRDARPEELGN
jgi:FKBP-type peptidyl-prolyl cis-trans isomerase 2